MHHMVDRFVCSFYFKNSPALQLHVMKDLSQLNIPKHADKLRTPHPPRPPRGLAPDVSLKSPNPTFYYL